MRRWFLIFIGLSLLSCSEVRKPKNLISKDEMAQIFLENALYNNSSVGGRMANPQTVGRYILAKHKIDSQQYVDSYKYYLAKKDIPEIMSLAKQKIEGMDPGFKDYLKKQQTGTAVQHRNQVLKYGE